MRLSTFSPALLALFGGGLFTLGFAPFFLWPLALMGLALLFWGLTRQTLWFIWWWGMGYYVTSLYWLPRSFMIDAGGSWAPAFYAGIPALLAICGILTLGFLLVGFISKRTPWPAAMFGVGWLGLEWLRTLPPLQFPWNPAGAIFAGDTILMQTAGIGGVWLLSAVALACGWALSQNNKYAWFAPVILAGMVGYGQARLSDAPVVFGETAFRLVQGNLETAHNWRGDDRERHLWRMIELMDAKSHPEVDLFVWPETAVAFAVAEDRILQRLLADELLPHQALVLGFMRWEDPPGEPRRFFNSMGVLDAFGALTEIYDKHKLVPFGEGLPFPELSQRVIRTLAFNRGTYWPGDQPAVMQMGDIAALPLICYEGAFSGFVQRELAEQQVLINITNDNWFDGTTSPHQHFSLARLRTVETGLPMMRVASTGVTVVVDGYGRILSVAPLRAEAVLDVLLPLPAPRPFYAKVWAFFLK